VLKNVIFPNKLTPNFDTTVYEVIQIEVKFIQSIGSKVLIEEMSEIFSRLGYPKKLRTDNGRQYVSVELKKIL